MSTRRQKLIAGLYLAAPVEVPPTSSPNHEAGDRSRSRTSGSPDPTVGTGRNRTGLDGYGRRRGQPRRLDAEQAIREEYQLMVTPRPTPRSAPPSKHPGAQDAAKRMALTLDKDLHPTRRS